jgi:hypothetical protein
MFSGTLYTNVYMNKRLSLYTGKGYHALSPNNFPVTQVSVALDVTHCFLLRWRYNRAKVRLSDIDPALLDD